MEYELICKDCNQVFKWSYPSKERCPSCWKLRRAMHKRNSGIKYRNSPKGRANYEKRRKYGKNKPKKESSYCIDCGKILRCKRNTRCKSCFMIVLRSHTREKHPNWKGGIQKTVDGYILIKTPNHPRTRKSGHVPEHVLVWEKDNGKYLPEGWVIHHLNGIKDDNRIENLAALPNRKHYHVLQAKSKRIQELEGLLKKQFQLI